MLDKSNHDQQTLKKTKPEKVKTRERVWKAINSVLQIGIALYKILDFIFGEG